MSQPSPLQVQAHPQIQIQVVDGGQLLVPSSSNAECFVSTSRSAIDQTAQSQIEPSISDPVKVCGLQVTSPSVVKQELASPVQLQSASSAGQAMTPSGKTMPTTSQSKLSSPENNVASTSPRQGVKRSSSPVTRTINRTDL